MVTVQSTDVRPVTGKPARCFGRRMQRSKETEKKEELNTVERQSGRKYKAGVTDVPLSDI